MESNVFNGYRRPHAAELARRLGETRRHLQVVTGARQVGRTTLVQQVTEDRRCRVLFVSADERTPRDGAWLRQPWDAARLASEPEGGVLVVDEVQKVEQWSEMSQGSRRVRIVPEVHGPQRAAPEVVGACERPQRRLVSPSQEVLGVALMATWAQSSLTNRESATILSCGAVVVVAHFTTRSS